MSARRRPIRPRGTKRRLDALPSNSNKVLPNFTGSAAGTPIDRGDNTLFQVPIDPSGALSFGNWPYPGKGLYGLGYNFKPLAAVVMPVLLIAALALLYPGMINAARFGRKKRSVREEQPDEAEDELNSLHHTVVAATQACVQRFACESQEAVKKTEFGRGFLSIFARQNHENSPGKARIENLPGKARMNEEEDSCAHYGCDLVSNIFAH